MYCAFKPEAIAALPKPKLNQRSRLPFFRQWGMDVLTSKY
jgi:hypothetical protein